MKEKIVTIAGYSLLIIGILLEFLSEKLKIGHYGSIAILLGIGIFALYFYLDSRKQDKQLELLESQIKEMEEKLK